jgi:hypothetical protein
MRWSIEKGLVAIKSVRAYPLTLPNVARNVIAHELGHAIGLAHNSDPTMLICGRPAPCRPMAFQYFRRSGLSKQMQRVSNLGHFLPWRDRPRLCAGETKKCGNGIY